MSTVPRGQVNPDTGRPSRHEVVVFGAGSVGRGFIGQLFSEASWAVTFVDAVPELVNALATAGEYSHVTMSCHTAVPTVIGPVTALHARDSDAVVRAVTRADLVVTCVGARALPRVIETIARALDRRIDKDCEPLDILLAENLHDGARIVRGILAQQLPDVPANVLDSKVGLMEASIGRMIPAPDPEPLVAQTAIRVEPYRFLPFDAAAGRGAPLDVPGLVADPSVPFAFYGDRKLYVHNMGHYLCGVLGHYAGYGLLWESVADPQVRYFTRSAMLEAALGLGVRYNYPQPRLVEHVDDLLHRFDNRALGDTVERVIRDPQRKMAPHDRVLGAFSLAINAGTPARYLSLAVAAGASYLEMVENWTLSSVRSYLWEAAARTGVVWRDDYWALLDGQLTAFSDHGFDFAEQVRLIGDQFDPPRIP